jgi:hypothetical protein
LIKKALPDNLVISGELVQTIQAESNDQLRQRLRRILGYEEAIDVDVVGSEPEPVSLLGHDDRDD